jgi:Rrf2 family protein
MRLTTKSQYGLKVLGLLVRNYRGDNNPFLQVSVLSKECKASQKYLEQVLAPLVRQGVIETKRGQHGGYRLNRDPSEVSLAQALGSLEGILMPIPEWAESGGDETPPVGKVLRRIRDSICEILDETTIEVLASETHSSEDVSDETMKDLVYYI